MREFLCYLIKSIASKGLNLFVPLFFVMIIISSLRVIFEGNTYGFIGIFLFSFFFYYLKAYKLNVDVWLTTPLTLGILIFLTGLHGILFGYIRTKLVSSNHSLNLIIIGFVFMLCGISLYWFRFYRENKKNR